jgi:hypothetical protein
MIKIIRTLILTFIIFLPERFLSSHQINNAHYPSYHTINIKNPQLSTKTRAPQQLSENLEDITCLIVDLKYDGNTLKILEFGEINKSLFWGHKKLFGSGIMWKRLWLYLKQFNLPIWYVGHIIGEGADPKYRNIAYKTFKRYGGRLTEDFYTIKRDPIFKKLTSQENTCHEDQKVGIIVTRHHNMSRTTMRNFKEEYPQFIFLNKAAVKHVNNKYKTALLFNTPELQQYRPLWKTYKKEYSSTLAQTIISDLKNIEIFVIKPLDAVKGHGVLMVHKNELDNTLRTILTDKQKLLKINDNSYSWWYRDKNNDFLVEEYVASKPVFYNGKNHDGTIRMVFTLAKNNDTIDLTFLSGYWKFSLHALDDNVPLTQLYKSKSGCTQPSLPISSEDQNHMEELLRKVLPPIYQNMLDHNKKHAQ